MKKFLLPLLLMFSAPAYAQEASPLCYSLSNLTESVMRGRQLGMSREFILSQRDPHADQTTNDLILSVVDIVYSISIHTPPQQAADVVFAACVGNPVSP